jgi:hypothetical protein
MPDETPFRQSTTERYNKIKANREAIAKSYAAGKPTAEGKASRDKKLSQMDTAMRKADPARYRKEMSEKRQSKKY